MEWRKRVNLLLSIFNYTAVRRNLSFWPWPATAKTSGCGGQQYNFKTTIFYCNLVPSCSLARVELRLDTSKGARIYEHGY